MIREACECECVNTNQVTYLLDSRARLVLVMGAVDWLSPGIDFQRTLTRRGLLSFAVKRIASKVLAPAALTLRQYSLCERQSCKKWRGETEELVTGHWYLYNP